jgi:ribosome-associated protein YbcJ (S4-like RNA binding protein)
MPNKPIKQGYKLYDIIDHGYIYSWIWSLKKYRLEAILPEEGLINIGAMIKALISTLLCIGIMIYIDNYFMSIPLFKSLRTKVFRAVDTTRAHKAFPKELVQLKSNRVKLK